MTRRKMAVAVLVALVAMAPVTTPTAQTGTQGPAVPGPVTIGQPAMPNGLAPLPPEWVVQWNEQFFTTFREEARTIEGPRDVEGRLLNGNGEVIPETVQVAALAVRKGLVVDFERLAVTYEQDNGLPRDEKVQLGKNLEIKATELRAARAEYEGAKARLASFQADEKRYPGEVQELSLRMAYGDGTGAAEMAEQIKRNSYYQFLAARSQYAALLDATPLLGVKIDGTFGYDLFLDPDVFSNAAPGTRTQLQSDQGYVDMVNTLLDAGRTQAQAQADEYRAYTNIDQLAILSTDRFLTAQMKWTRMGLEMGSMFLPNLMSELQYAADGQFKNWTAKAWEDSIEDGLVVIAVGSIFLPGGVFIAAGVSVIQIGSAGGDVYIAYANAERAEDTAALTGFNQVLVTQDALAAEQKTLFFTAAASSLDFYGAYKGIKIAIAADEAAAARAALAAANAPPASAAGVPPGALPPAVADAPTVIVRPGATGSGTFVTRSSELGTVGGPGGTQVLRPAELPPGAFAPGARVYLTSDLTNMASPNYINARLLANEYNFLTAIFMRVQGNGGRLLAQDALEIAEKGGLKYLDDAAKSGFVDDAVVAAARTTDEVGARLDPLLSAGEGRDLARLYDEFRNRPDLAPAPGAAAVPTPAPAGGAATGVTGGRSTVAPPPAAGPAVPLTDPLRNVREVERVWQAMTDDERRANQRLYDETRQRLMNQPTAPAAGSGAGGAIAPPVIPDEYFNLVPGASRPDTSTPPPAPPEFGWLFPSTTGGSDPFFLDPGAPASPQFRGNPSLASFVTVPVFFRLGSPDGIQDIVVLPVPDQTGRLPEPAALSMADRLLAPLRWLLSRPSSVRADRAITIWPSRRTDGAASSIASDRQAAPGLKLFFTALGGSAGKVMQMTVVNDGDVPVRLSREAFAVEPVARVSKVDVDREVGRLRGAPPVTSTIEAYCLERLKLPPDAGMVFRLAGPDLQQRYAGVRGVLKATADLTRSGRLVGGMGDANYATNVKQWAVWASQERLDEAGFARAFLEHTRKTVTGARSPWTRELEAAVKSVIPGRWQDLQAILTAAGVASR